MLEYHVILCALCNRGVYTVINSDLKDKNISYGKFTVTLCKLCKMKRSTVVGKTTIEAVKNISTQLSLLDGMLIVPMIYTHFVDDSKPNELILRFTPLEIIESEPIENQLPNIERRDMTLIRLTYLGDEFRSISATGIGPLYGDFFYKPIEKVYKPIERLYKP